MQLTQEQKNIIQHRQGHARVRAVAGSGKTTTMVERICHLLKKGVNAQQILVLMFNKSARDSFNQALLKRLDSTDLVSPEIRTFHSLGLRLTESFTRRGELPEFKLITEERYKEHLVRQTIQQVAAKQGEDLWDIKEKLEELIEFIDLVKAHYQQPAQVAKEIDLPSKLAWFIDAYELFEQLRKQQQVRFYADLISEPLSALQANDELQAWVANRVDYIVVDEYQDINESQQQLLRYVAGTRAQVMVVGDGDQCIYEWRGAKPEYISHRFVKDFPNPVDYSLSYTFRYGHRLSLAANHLISNNPEKGRKLCLSHADNFNTQIECCEMTTGAKHPILQILTDWQNQNRKLEEAAVLVRLYAMSIPVELALLEAGISYKLLGGATVFNCPEIKALTGYLMFCFNGLEDISVEERQDYLQAMFTQPHIGLKKNQLEQFIDGCSEKPELIPFYISELISEDLPAFRKKKLKEYADIWQWLAGLDGSEDGAFVLKQLINRFDLYNFYQDYSARQSVAENRIQTCESLIRFVAGKFLSISEFLSTFETLKNERHGKGGGLLITTVHRAKGLEWPLVILPGLDQGNFPFEQKNEKTQTGKIASFEDERRLFYVAMTRAVEQLYLIHPSDYSFQQAFKVGRGSVQRQINEPVASCFLYEANIRVSGKVGAAITGQGSLEGFLAEDVTMSNDYLKRVNADCGLVEKHELTQAEKEMSTFKKRLTIAEAKEGVEIIHDKFGEGKITQIADKKQGRIKASFAHHGEVVLLLAYAKVYSLNK